MDEYELPALYGGICECKAGCIYSEKGPWTEVENLINYQNPEPESSDDDNVDENDNLKFKLMGFGGGNMQGKQ